MYNLVFDKQNINDENSSNSSRSKQSDINNIKNNEDEMNNNPNIISENKHNTFSKCSYFCWNVYLRHLYLTPFLRKSQFNKRYKKIFIFNTYLNLILLFIMLCYSFDDSFTFNSTVISTTLEMMHLIKFAGYTVISVVLANIIIIPFIYILIIPNGVLVKLYDEIVKNKSLDLLKQMSILKRENILKTAIGIFLALVVVMFIVYYSITFCAVWNEWIITVTFSFGFAVILDAFVFELFIETIIVCGFKLKNKSECCGKIYKYLSSYRHFKAMS